mmetsp:Transcript_64330/g.170394  ORF Transcript_64330/g.170394 Transcript_64330/m.170394 type:complete len:261 (-) Transcript_64330:103-885(-)
MGQHRRRRTQSVEGCLAAGESQLRASSHQARRKTLARGHVGSEEHNQCLAPQLLEVPQGRRVGASQLDVEARRCQSRRRRRRRARDEAQLNPLSAHEQRIRDSDVSGRIDAKVVRADKLHQSNALLDEGQLHADTGPFTITEGQPGVWRSLRCLLALPTFWLEGVWVFIDTRVIVQSKGGYQKRRTCWNSILPEGRLPLGRADFDEVWRWRKQAEVLLHHLCAVDELSQHVPRERLVPDDARHLIEHPLLDLGVGRDVVH